MKAKLTNDAIRETFLEMIGKACVAPIDSRLEGPELRQVSRYSARVFHDQTIKIDLSV